MFLDSFFLLDSINWVINLREAIIMIKITTVIIVF